jgi:hypothetical protein
MKEPRTLLRPYWSEESTRVLSHSHHRGVWCCALELDWAPRHAFWQARGSFCKAFQDGSGDLTTSANGAGNALQLAAFGHLVFRKPVELQLHLLGVRCTAAEERGFVTVYAPPAPCVTYLLGRTADGPRWGVETNVHVI